MKTIAIILMFLASCSMPLQRTTIKKDHNEDIKNFALSLALGVAFFAVTGFDIKSFKL